MTSEVQSMQVQVNPELTVKEAARMAGVSDAHIRRLLIAGTLRGRKLNNWLWLVRRSEVDHWLAGRKRD